MNRVVVVGDVLLDRDLIGRAQRLCPDAPVPVVDEELVVERPGGAGLAAALVRDHGVEVTLIAAFAQDDGGERLREILTDLGIRIVPLLDSGTTTEKLRVRVDGHSLLRLDRGAAGDLGPLRPEGVAAVRAADAVLVSDYGRGVSAHHDVRAALSSAADLGTAMVWDPHPRGTPPVAGTTVVTPNRDEAEHFAGSPVRTSRRPLAAAIAAAATLRADWAVGTVAVTMGADGAVVVGPDAPPRVVPVSRPALGSDPCGAGDAFAAAATVALADGADAVGAVRAAVAAASAFVHDGGAARLAGPPASAMPRAVPHRDAAASTRGAGRTRTVVATGGCFDVLHPGHVATLEHARRLGDHLVVLVNDDASVRRLKGPTRPAQRCEDRVAVLRSLACVDEVVVFSEDTPVATLRRLRPDVFVKGGDYDAATMPETDAVAEWGGVVVTVPYLAGRSTTEILGRRDRLDPEPVPAGSAGFAHGSAHGGEHVE